VLVHGNFDSWLFISVDKSPLYIMRKSATGSGNPWIQHVKKVQKEKGISYKEALNAAKLTYKK